MDSESDINKMCRLCLEKEQVGVHIFEEESDENQIFLKIRTCLPVKISHDDRLPKNICTDCSCKLDTMYQFWNKSLHSETMLLTWLDPSNVENVTTEDNSFNSTNLHTEVFVKEEIDILKTENDIKIEMMEESYDDESCNEPFNEFPSPESSHGKRKRYVPIACKMDPNDDSLLQEKESKKRMNEEKLFYNVSTRIEKLTSNARNKAKKNRTQIRKDPSEAACNDFNTLDLTRTTESNLPNLIQENTNYNNSAVSDNLADLSGSELGCNINDLATKFTFTSDVINNLHQETGAGADASGINLNEVVPIEQKSSSRQEQTAAIDLREPGDESHFILGEYCDFDELPHMGQSSPRKPTGNVYINSSKESKRKNMKSPIVGERNKMKLARMKGEGYTGYTRIRQGIKFVVKRSLDKREKRKMGPMCSSNMCNTSRIRKCKFFTQEDRIQIFEKFWDLPWEGKQIMVSDLVQLSPTKQPTATNKHPNIKSRRSWTLIYHLPKNNERHNVCKRFFLSTLGVNEWMAINWVKKHADSQKGETLKQFMQK